MDGNRGAQETLYNKYRKIVKDFIRSKYSIYYDIDDDVSEIVIKVFLGLNTYDNSKSKFNSWVLNITKHYMIDKWRSNTITLASLSNANIAVDGQYFTTANASSNALEWSTSDNCVTFAASGSITCSNTDFENCSSINYITTQLSPADYTLLDMKYVQGYDYNEIGKEFNLTSSTISNKVNYIKTKLKKDKEIVSE